MTRYCKQVRCIFSLWVHPWVAEAMIRGLLPERIGRYRLLDVLLDWTDDNYSKARVSPFKFTQRIGVRLFQLYRRNFRGWVPSFWEHFSTSFRITTDEHTK